MNLTSEQGLTVLRKFTVSCRNLLVSTLVACASENTVHLASTLRISGIIFSAKKLQISFSLGAKGENSAS